MSMRYEQIGTKDQKKNPRQFGKTHETVVNFLKPAGAENLRVKMFTHIGDTSAILYV